jgi:hypothetical protein
MGRARFVAGVYSRQWSPGVDLCTEPRQLVEADRVIDRIRVSMVVTTPSAEANTSRTIGAGARWPSIFSTKSVGPPSSDTILLKCSVALPVDSAACAACRALPSNPVSSSAAALRARVTSISRASRCLPVRKSTALRISSALPAALASGSFMSVINAPVFVPAPLATATRLSASSRDLSSVGMNAPEPVFTSRISAWRPAASFFDRIEAVISETFSTVPVTSRIE